MKSMDELRSGCYTASPHGSNATNECARELERDIYRDIERYYVERPEFNEGEVICIGDGIVTEHGDKIVENYFVGDDGTVYVNGHIIDSDTVICPGERAERASALEIMEHDTQEKLDADLRLSPVRYCEKYGIEFDPYYFVDTVGESYYEFDASYCSAATKHMLERQRKLDGMENGNTR